MIRSPDILQPRYNFQWLLYAPVLVTCCPRALWRGPALRSRLAVGGPGCLDANCFARRRARDNPSFRRCLRELHDQPHLGSFLDARAALAASAGTDAIFLRDLRSLQGDRAWPGGLPHRLSAHGVGVAGIVASPRRIS